MYNDKGIEFLSSLYETLSEDPSVSQRGIAERLGISLGLTNAWLSKLAGKGWIMMQRVSGKKIKYVLTPEGMKMLAARSAHFMKKTFALMRQYGDTITNRISEAKRMGFCKVILCGTSSLDFLIEYACNHCEIPFEKQDSFDTNIKNLSNVYIILAENLAECMEEQSDKNFVTVFDLTR